MVVDGGRGRGGSWTGTKIWVFIERGGGGGGWEERKVCCGGNSPETGGTGMENQRHRPGAWLGR